jgi:hypothetical protein
MATGTAVALVEQTQHRGVEGILIGELACHIQIQITLV